MLLLMQGYVSLLPEAVRFLLDWLLPPAGVAAGYGQHCRGTGGGPWRLQCPCCRLLAPVSVLASGLLWAGASCTGSALVMPCLHYYYCHRGIATSEGFLYAAAGEVEVDKLNTLVTLSKVQLLESGPHATLCCHFGSRSDVHFIPVCALVPCAG